MPRFKDARRFNRCADLRYLEASILIQYDQPTGSVYLAGYVVECMLKALNLETQPGNRQEVRLEELKKIGHNLVVLLELYVKESGRKPPANVARAFAPVLDWSPEIRYDPKEVEPREASRFFKAVGDIYHWADGRL